MILNWTVPLPCYTPELKQPNLQCDYAQELALSTTLNLFWVVWTFNTTRLGSIVRSNCDAGLCSSTAISKLLLCTLDAHHELLAATIHDECLLLLCRVLHWTLPWMLALLCDPVALNNKIPFECIKAPCQLSVNMLIMILETPIKDHLHHPGSCPNWSSIHQKGDCHKNTKFTFKASSTQEANRVPCPTTVLTLMQLLSSTIKNKLNTSL